MQGEPDRDVFELRPPSDVPKKCGRGRMTELIIELPKTRGTLDTERIMIRPSALQTQYLPDARWGDTVPVTLQTLLVRGFGVYDVFNHVGRAPLGSVGDYAIISEINDFNAEGRGQGRHRQADRRCPDGARGDSTVVARGHFATSAEAPSTKTDDLVPAFDVAGQQLVAPDDGMGLRAAGVNPPAAAEAALFAGRRLSPGLPRAGTGWRGRKDIPAASSAPRFLGPGVPARRPAGFRPAPAAPPNCPRPRAPRSAPESGTAHGRRSG